MTEHKFTFHFQNRVEEFLKEADMRVGNSFHEELDDKIRLLIEDSVRRARENQRSTVMGRDV